MKSHFHTSTSGKSARNYIRMLDFQKVKKWKKCFIIIIYFHLLCEFSPCSVWFFIENTLELKNSTNNQTFFFVWSFPSFVIRQTKKRIRYVGYDKLYFLYFLHFWSDELKKIMQPLKTNRISSILLVVSHEIKCERSC